MKQTKTELMQMIETAAKGQTQSWERHEFKTFKKSLCDFIGVSYDKIQLKEVANVREANQLIKFRELENAYILLVLKNQNYRMALIDIETKKRLAKLNYYCQDKVSVKKEIEDGATCYVIYNDDKQEKARLKELKGNRIKNKEGSHLVRNSIYHRHKYEFRSQIDKAGFKNKMMDLHKKMALRFLNHDVNYLLDKISEKEQRLFNLYQKVRNDIYKTDKEINTARLHTPSPFYEQLDKMRDAIMDLQNIEEKAKKFNLTYPNESVAEFKQRCYQNCKEDIITNYIYIIEKEESFKEGLRDFILINTKKQEK